MTDFLIVIPARYKSSRFPGKPLAQIKGKSMIQRVWEKCTEAVGKDKILVATDHKKIKNHCETLDIPVLMTSEECLTGSDRIYEVAQKIEAEIYVNVQGDEPLISSSDINEVINATKKHKGKVICAMCPIDDEIDFRNLNVPKVVTRLDGQLLYMSRAPIPSNKQDDFSSGKKQVCIYGFPRNILLEFGSYGKKSTLEAIEDLELLRLLELGHEIQMIDVSSSSIAVDTPEDLDRVRKLVK